MFQHHPAFQDIVPFCGDVPEAFDVNYLGIVNRRYWGDVYVPPAPEQFVVKRHVATELPRLDEEYFEHIDVIEAVLNCSTPCFTMIELGAGWGRWLLNAVGVIRRRRPTLEWRLIGVEADIQHFHWMEECLADNNVRLPAEDLIAAAVGGREEERFFTVGDPAAWWGQSLLNEHQNRAAQAWLRQSRPGERLRPNDVIDLPGSPTRLAYVPAIVLSKLVERCALVDLIDMDIQDAEREVVPEAVQAMNHKVKRVHIGTHSREGELRIRESFAAHGWQNIWDFPSNNTFNGLYFQDGVQGWINPRL